MFLRFSWRFHYWRSKKARTIRRKTKLSPLNQLFLLNLSVKDMAYRLGISTELVSQYVTTWICFMYHQLKEINWMPSITQVARTLPFTFKENNTYVITDASEVFIETSSDLHLQCSTWSNYKHHNSGKFLIGCTPHGVICCFSILCRIKFKCAVDTEVWLSRYIG